MRTILHNTKMKEIEFLTKIDRRDKVTFERSFLDKVKKFLRLPYYELVTVYENGNIDNVYLVKVFPKTKEVFVF